MYAIEHNIDFCCLFEYYYHRVDTSNRWWTQMKKVPATIRTGTVAKIIDSVQSAVTELLEGDKREGAILALNLLRKELGILKDEKK